MKKFLKSSWYSIWIGGQEFIFGDQLSIEVIFNNLDGINFVDRGKHAHENWLRHMVHLYPSTKFEEGRVISMWSPNEVIIKKSRIGESLKFNEGVEQ